MKIRESICRLFFGISGLLLLPFLLAMCISATGIVQAKGNDLQVHFINAGQGDATLITCGGEAMLIDAGDDSKGTAVQKYLKNQGVSELKYVIVTHPDADHIGGMDVIITKFNCGLIFMPDVEKDTNAYRDVLNTMKYRGYQKTVPVVGDIYQLGGAEFQIVSPAFTYSESNNNSIVVRLAYGRNSFLFTGDAEVQAQQEMTYGGYTIQSDVMKIPHHGGTSGFQKWFYNEVKPAYAVISCGKGNSYGHPHEEVLTALRELGISVFRTDEQGSIIASSNGTEITWSCNPSNTWAAGEQTQEKKPQPVQEEQITEKAAVVAEPAVPVNENAGNGINYILNTNTKKFHYPSCSSVGQMKDKNKKESTESRDAIISQGYQPCKRCKP